MISQPKLPDDNISLLDKIQELLVSKIEVKIRVETLDGKKQVLVATIHGFSKKPTGRVDMEKLQHQFNADNTSNNHAKAALMKKPEEVKKKLSQRPAAKKRLVYHDRRSPSSPYGDDSTDSQNDMFVESLSGEYEEEDSREGSGLLNGQNIHDENLFHKPSPGSSENNVEMPMAIHTAASSATDEVSRHMSLLSENFSTPSRRQQISDMKDRISDLEGENGFLFHKMDEKDTEIESLKAEIRQLKSLDPNINLVERITAALSAVNEIANSSAESNGAANRNISRHSTSSEQIMVQLVQGHNLKIEKSDLKFAITIGRLSSGNLHLMVNKILESVYTRIYMSEHSLSGMAPRAKKLANTPPTPVKPGLPKEDVVAISLFMIQAWKTYHGQVIKPNDVRLAIRSKLSTETRAMLTAIGVPPPEATEREEGA